MLEAERVRAVASGVESDTRNPVLDQALILARSQMRTSADPAREEPVSVSKPSFPDPGIQCLARCGRDLETDRRPGLLLDHARALPGHTHLGNIGHRQAHQIAAPELGVDGEIEEGEVANALGKLKADADRPDLLRLQRRLLAARIAIPLVVDRLRHDHGQCRCHESIFFRRVHLS